MGLYLIFWILIIFWILKAKKKNAAGRSTAGRSNSRQTSARQRPEPRSTYRRETAHTSASSRPKSPNRSRKASAESDAWYDEREVNAADITFRGLRPGTDELEVLIRHNTRYEKTLERRLVSRESD